MVNVRNVKFSAKTQLWCVVVVAILAMVLEVAALNGPNVCMVKQKYNITKRVKYRAPMSVRTYEWCMAMPPRCSKWYTEMRDLTRLETEERTAEVAVCCPGYKMKDVACVPICPSGRTGHGCSEECPESKWGPNCVNDCQPCSDRGTCSSITGKCSCQEGWQGESCESRMTSTTSTTTTTTATVEELLTKKPATKPTPPITSTIPSTTRTAFVDTTSFTISRTSATEITTSTSRATLLENTTSPSTIPFKDTTLTPKTTLTTVTSSPKNSTSSESSLRSSVITLKEDAIVNTSPLTTPATSTLAVIEVATTKAPVTTTNILTPETASTKSRTTEVSIQSTIEENKLSTERKTYKELVIQRADNNLTPSTTTERYYPTTVYNNVTITTHGTTEPFKSILETTTKITSIHSRTEHPYETRKYIEEVPVEIKTTPIKIIKTNELFSTVIPQKTTTSSASHESQMVTTAHATTTTEETTKAETTRRPDATIRYFPTTVKFKPKEIWIRPAQKGEAFTETKKSNHDLHLRHRVASNKEPVPNTTPKTIIVSIIPTSVSYATFKKIALTTASLLPQTTNMTLKPHSNFTEQGITKPMSVFTSTLSPTTSKSNSLHSTVENAANSSISKSVNSSKSNTHFYKVSKTLSVLSSAATTWKNKTKSLNETNSMTTVTQNLNSSNSVTPTISSTNFIKTTHKPSVTMGTSKSKDVTRHLERVTNKPFIKIVTTTPRNVTTKQVSEKRNDTTKIAKTIVKDIEKTNATKTKDNINAKTNKITTESPDYEETFHILTEPEHITAVMEGKGKERTSVDLISVISIAGGIMMAVITVAVIIVMIERCRRPRYEDVRKMNDIHMQVMIDNNDVPPPYVRSIFHTPLPDPPSSEKCHYQPISTLDRNLKQFMRPVVVKTISPIMLENFREILECHYDHLPRRSRDFEVRHTHCSIAPSIDDVDERTHLRPCSFTESTIDALKCEAKLDVLDSTTSEPLYAEIPCWRPPSEHAIEIMNLNGEAVTEL